METEGTRYLADLKPCVDIWKSIDLRIQAVKDEQLGWRCEILRGTLIHEDRKEPSSWMRPPAIPDLLVLHEYWPISRLHELVSMLEAGELLIGGEHVMVKRHVGNQQYSPSSLYMRSYDRTEANQRYGLDWKTTVLSAWEGFSPSQELNRARERVDSQLQSGNPPWDGIADVRRNFIGMTEDESRRSDFMSCEVLAPFLLRFGPCTVDGDRLSLDLRIERTINLADVGIGIVFLFGDQTAGRTHIGLGKGGHEVADGHVKISADLPEVASSAMTILTYRKVAVDRKRLFKAASLAETRQWLAFRTFVGGPTELSEALRTAKGGDPFEHAVSTLLHLLGFATGHYGQKTFGGDMTDLFATYSDEGWSLVVECTVRELDLAAKIAKLVTRAKSTARTTPGEVYPTLVTRQPRTDISDTAREDAAREKVILITGDDLDGLVQLATELPSPEKVRNHMLRLIPAQVR